VLVPDVQFTQVRLKIDLNPLGSIVRIAAGELYKYFLAALSGIGHAPPPKDF
jgi:hypothetical protein